MKAHWDGPILCVQTGTRHIFRHDHTTAGGHDVQELWRWWCKTCTKKPYFVGGNGEDLDEALDWFVAHLDEAHADDEGGE